MNSRKTLIISTGAGILAVLGIRLIDYLSGTRILLSIWEGVAWFFKLIGNFFAIRFDVPLWFLILLPIIVVGLIVFVLWIISLFQENNTNNVSHQAPFLNYTEDTFGELLYRWEYVKDYSGKYNIINVSKYCPACKCSIVYDSCPVCRKNYYNKGKSESELNALIRHRIENRQ